ncbi:MAG TPA: polyamine aminopropyltransferase [bacterium]|nr:polyamine aminopropyltransferase [bacterium]
MEWIVDIVGPGFAQATQVQDILFDDRSAFQHIQVASSPLFGRMLILDDAVQTTERDEYIYHEMLAHLPLLTHPAPRRVLIIGGGDGGTLEETLKHPIEHATLVEIDQDVVTVSRRFLPFISGGAFDDARTRLVIADGIEFVRTTPERFDVILVDSTDPKGPGLALFSPEFYAACTHVLAPDGLLVAQSGSLLYQRELTEMVRRHLRTAFPVVGTYWAAVPAYPGVLWGFSYGSLRHDPGRVNRTAISKRLTTIPTRLYSADTHAAALQLPGLPDA